jgi:DNA-binding NarL/FixJ family response regulator
MVTDTRKQLGEQAFAATWAQGQAMTLDQVLAAQREMSIAEPVSTISPVSQPPPPAKTSPKYPAGLTEREVEVLRLLAQGLTNAQIAEQFVLSIHTVNAHVRSIFTKINVTSRSAATRFAFEHHLV